MSSKPFQVAIALDQAMAASILSKERYNFLRTFAQVNPIEELPEKMTLSYMEKILDNADACITCWGTPASPRNCSIRRKSCV